MLIFFVSLHFSRLFLWTIDPLIPKKFAILQTIHAVFGNFNKIITSYRTEISMYSVEEITVLETLWLWFLVVAAQRDIGVFPKWAELSLNSENSGNLINHASMNWAQFQDHVFLSSGSIMVCYTRDSRLEYSFFAKIFFKLYRFCRFYRIHLGETPFNLYDLLRKK